MLPASLIQAGHKIVSNLIKLHNVFKAIVYALFMVYCLFFCLFFLMSNDISSSFVPSEKSHCTKMTIEMSHASKNSIFYSAEEILISLDL